MKSIVYFSLYSSKHQQSKELSSSTNMEKIIAECKTIWTEEQNQHAIRIIQDGLSGKKLSGGDYHIIKKFEVVSMGGVYKIRNK